MVCLFVWFLFSSLNLLIKLFFVLKRVILWLYTIIVLLCSCVFVSRYHWRYWKIRPQGQETVKVYQLSEKLLSFKVQIFRTDFFKKCVKLPLEHWAIFLCCTVVQNDTRISGVFFERVFHLINLWRHSETSYN